MMWLTWRQFRAQAIATAAGLVLVAIVLGVTGAHLADRFNASGIIGCQAHGSCQQLADNFISSVRGTSYTVVFDITVALIYLVPALVGLFWGAPLIAREVEAGTLRLAWTQSVARTRWLVVKISLIGLVAMATAGLLSLMAGWWAHPFFQAAAQTSSQSANVNRFPPLLFGATGIAPIGYAAFGFALGLTVGLLIRRTLPAMAVTLAVFGGIQVAWPFLIRPHLSTPLRGMTPITSSNISDLLFGGPSHTVSVTASTDKPGAWIISHQALDTAGRPYTGPPPHACVARGFQACNAAIGRLHLRQLVTYQPASRYWEFQWYETAIFGAVALALVWFCYRRVSRRRVT